MITSILIALDGSQNSNVATELAVRWAGQFGAELVGFGIVDTPGIRAHFDSGFGRMPPALSEEKLDNLRSATKRCLDKFRHRCDEAGVSARVELREGLPHEEILLEAQRHDLILLGRRTSFRYEGFRDALVDVVKHAPCPVVVVPDADRSGTTAVVAYDGSLQAARALRAFQASGLWKDNDLTIVSIEENQQEAVRCGQYAVQYLANHDIRAELCAVVPDSAVEHALLQKVDELDAGLLVMGAYGLPTVKEFFLGTVTKHILEASAVPVFVYH